MATRAARDGRGAVEAATGAGGGAALVEEVVFTSTEEEVEVDVMVDFVRNMHGAVAKA